MQTFVVCIEETCVQQFEVEAKDERQALAVAQERYRFGEFVLAPGELHTRRMAVVMPEESATPWTEF